MYNQFFTSLENKINKNKTRLNTVSDSLNTLYEMYKWYKDVYTNTSVDLVTVRHLKNDIDNILAICYRLDIKNDATVVLITCTLDFIESRLEETFFIVFRSIDLICKELEFESISMRNAILEEMRSCGLNISNNEFDLFDWVTKPSDVERPSVDDIINNKPEILPPTTDEDEDNLPSEPDENKPTEEPDVDTNEPTTETDKETDEPNVNQI